MKRNVMICIHNTHISVMLFPVYSDYNNNIVLICTEQSDVLCTIANHLFYQLNVMLILFETQRKNTGDEKATDQVLKHIHITFVIQNFNT